MNAIFYGHGCEKDSFDSTEVVLVSNTDLKTTHCQCFCSECKQILTIDYTDNIGVKYLINRGVQHKQTSLPDELFEPRGRGDPINHDDLLDFHNNLEKYPDDLVSHPDFQGLR